MTIEELAIIRDNANIVIRECRPTRAEDTPSMLVGVVALLAEISIDLKKLLSPTTQ